MTKVNPRKILAIAVLALMFFQTNQRYAAKGDIAAGELLQEQGTNSNVSVNTTPCASIRNLVIFHEPYRIGRRDTATCRGAKGERQYVRAQIEQQ